MDISFQFKRQSDIKNHVASKMSHLVWSYNLMSSFPCSSIGATCIHSILTLRSNHGVISRVKLVKCGMKWNEKIK